MSASAKPTLRMSVEEFLQWHPAPPTDERFELLDGVPVAMAPATIGHGDAIYAINTLLRAAIDSGGLPCQVVQDSAGIRIDANSMFIPDLMVHCGERLVGSVREVAAPVIVVEIASPSTWRYDSNVKLDGYFQVPSVQHYLAVLWDKRRVIHHRRTADGSIETRILGDEAVRLDPPGILLKDIFLPL